MPINKEVLASIVEIVNADYPKKNIGSYLGVLKSEVEGPIVKSSNGQMHITGDAIADFDHYSTVPEYSKVMAESYVSDNPTPQIKYKFASYPLIADVTTLALDKKSVKESDKSKSYKENQAKKKDK